MARVGLAGRREGGVRGNGAGWAGRESTQRFLCFLVTLCLGSAQCVVRRCGRSPVSKLACSLGTLGICGSTENSSTSCSTGARWPWMWMERTLRAGGAACALACAGHAMDARLPPVWLDQPNNEMPCDAMRPY